MISSFRFISSMLFLTLLIWTSVEGQINRALPADKAAKVEQSINAWMTRLKAPGLSISVVTDNQLSFQKGFGMSNIENDVPARVSTVYRLASVAKPITGVAVMQLVEKGKIDLDAPVQKYVPSFPVKSHPVRIRDLLTHTSGIRHYKGDEFASTRHYKSLTEALSMFKDDPLEHEPGLKHTYTTHGYTLLGVIIEAASGMSFADYLRENIFKPAGMSQSEIDSVTNIIKYRASGYKKNELGEIRNADLADTSYKLPGGGLVSTVEDMARFAIALEKGTLIKKESFQLMTKNYLSKEIIERTFAPAKPPPGLELGYGFGWIIGSKKRKDSVWHGGVQQGVTTVIYLVPKERLALSIMTNLEGEGTEIENIADQVANIILQE